MTVSTRRIHVLEVIGNAILGGMETSVIRLVQRLPKDRFRISALCPREGLLAERLREADCDVHIIAMSQEPEWRAIQYGSVVARAEGVDVLHAHLSNAHLLAGLIGKLADIPVVASVHGRDVWIPDLEAHRLVDSHLCVVSRSSYYQALGAGVRADRLHCIVNGVDPEQFSPRPRGYALRRACGIPDHAPLAGFVGRLSPEKGPELFVRAAALAHADDDSLHFVMVGDGPMRERLAADAERSGLAGRFHFAGLWHDMPDAYADLDMVIAPSWSEGMPLALMEAMACALPVIATPVGGVPELVNAETTGLLVPSGDSGGIASAILQLAHDPDLRTRMGAAARARVQARFDLHEGVADFAALFETLAASDAGVDRRLTTLSNARRASTPSAAASSRANHADGSTAR